MFTACVALRDMLSAPCIFLLSIAVLSSGATDGGMHNAMLIKAKAATTVVVGMRVGALCGSTTEGPPVCREHRRSRRVVPRTFPPLEEMRESTWRGGG